MANADRPMGLSPHSYLNGAQWNGGGRVYCIPNTDDTNAYAIGDPVVLAGDADANGVPTVVLATAGSTNLVLGCIVSTGGIKYGGSFMDPASLDSTIIPATKSKDYYVLVCDDPNVIFEIQETNSGTALTSVAVGLNASLKVGTNNGYISGWTLDNATEATTTALQLKLLGLVQRADNAFGLASKWLVMINNHCYKAPTAGL